MNSLIAIFVLVLIVLTIIGGLLVLAHVITRYYVPSNSTANKQQAYECGVIGLPSKTNRVSSGFYLTAILFVLFDIEIIFLYPWAIAYRDFLNGVDGTSYLIALLIFLALFVLGLFWEIRAQALRWK